MAEQWWAIIDSRSGELHSVGTVVADPLPRGRSAVALAGQPDWRTDLWDAASRAIVPRPTPPPPADRVDDILNDPDILLVATVPAQLSNLRTVLERHLADPAVRYR